MGAGQTVRRPFFTHAAAGFAITPDMGMFEAREYRASASRAKHGFIIGGGMVALGLWMAFLAGETVSLAGELVSNQRETGLFIVLLGAAIAFYVWWKKHDTRAVLRIDETGVWCREWGVTVPWDQVDVINPTGNRLARLIVIRVAEPDRFIDSLPEAAGRKLRSNRLWKKPLLRLPDGYADAPLEELTATLRAAQGHFAHH
jgi:hypothetical protein